MRGMDVKNSRTKTTIFLLPLLGFYFKEDVLTDDFINAYTTVGDNLEEEGSIYLVYEFHKPGLFNRHDVKYFQYHGYHVYKLKFPEQTLKKFSEGKYSQFTPSEKSTILAFWGLSKGSRLHGILNPTTMMYENYNFLNNTKRRYEIWPKPNISEEAFI